MPRLLRKAAIGVTLLVLAVPVVVLAINAAVVWHPKADTGSWAHLEKADDPDRYLSAREDSVGGVKPEMRKGIRWHDSTSRAPTETSIVYLHGFSASREEISPVVERVADSLGANVYFTRLAAHGLVDGEAFATVRPQQWVDDAREAMAIGRRLGRRVVVVGMSTGALLALQLATEASDSTSPAAFVLISPNYALADGRSRLLAGPLGPQLARLLAGSHRGFTPSNDAHARIWTTRYRSEGLSALMDLVRHGESLDLSKVRVPVLTLYTSRDEIVDVEKIRTRHAELGSPVKEIIDVPGATDHVLTGDTMSRKTVAPVVGSILRFLRR